MNILLSCLNSRTWVVVRLLAAMTVIGLTAGLLIMGRQPVAVGLFTPPWDKLAHLTVFAVVGAAAGLASGATGTRLRLFWCVVAALTVGALDELQQQILPGRSASWADLLADGLGGLLGGASLHLAAAALPAYLKRR